MVATGGRAFYGLLWALLVLAGCAAQTEMARPKDFPLHATEDPFFNLHWRLDRKDGVVVAAGVVEAARVDGIADVIVELQELDSAGRVINRGLGRTYGGRLFQWDFRPFAVRLRPVGQEDRFEVKVWSYSWEGTRDHEGGRQ